VLIADLWREAGLPDDVFTVVHGDSVAVNALLDHPGVAGISFVGSTPVARHVFERATGSGKRCQALGGAKNHAVVLPDADVASAADALTAAGYGSAGERCMAVSAVVAVGDADPLVRELAERATALVTGPGTDPGSDMGPLITAAHRDRVAGYVGSAEDEGATVVVDGRDVKVPGADDGFFVGPTLVDHVTRRWRSTGTRSSARSCPCSVSTPWTRPSRWSTPTPTATARPSSPGTATPPGGSGGTSRWDGRGQRGHPVPMAYYSFGGWKDSLFGDAHIHGMEGVRFNTRLKSVTTRWPEPAGSGVPAAPIPSTSLGRQPLTVGWRC